MDHETLVRLISFWRRNFFIEPILILTFIFCFFVGLFYHHRQKERFFFLFYFFIGIALFTVSSPLVLFKIYDGRERIVASEAANTIFEVLEFIAFYFFFQKCIQNRNWKKLIKLFLISFLMLVSAFSLALTFPNYLPENIGKHSLYINVIEFLFLFIICLGYFYELFVTAPKTKLSERPSFFIVTSAFFYSILMIPFFMMAEDIFFSDKPSYYILFSFHFVLLMTLLITTVKTFFNRTPIST